MLIDMLLEAREQASRKLAVSDGNRELSYHRLTQLARILSEVVERETECPHVGLMLPASTAFPAALFGVLWAGRTAVPLNFLLSEQELAVVVEDAGLDVIITIRHFEDLASKLPARAVFMEDMGLRSKLAWALLRRLPAPPAVQEDDTAILLYTSGTTGIPKGVQLTYGNLRSNCVDTFAALSIDPDQVFLNVLPPFHVFGVTAMVLLPVMLKASVIALPRFSPLAMAKSAEAYKVTILVAIPSMFAAVLKTKSTTADAFRHTFLAISGGEPLPESVRNGFRERFNVELREGYGLTETSPVVAVNTLEHTRHGTVGRPVPHVELRIVDEEGREASSGHNGEILVRGPGVMKGYYNRPEETRAVLDDDGWFHTGDIGCVDEEGYLSITGRAKDMLIVGGENVFPREIEAALETHPAVLQVAVIGMPDDLRGEVPVAFVIPQHGATVSEQELREQAKRCVAGYKVPRRVIVHEELPVGPTGKLLKRKLRKWL